VGIGVVTFLLAFILSPVAEAAPTTSSLPFVVNSYLTGSQFQAHVARLNDDGFVVIWEDRPGGSQTAPDVAARVFDSNGVPRGNDFIVNAYTTGVQGDTRVAGLKNGGFVVVWRGYEDGNGSGISARMFDAAGAPIGGDFLVNGYTTSDQFFPSVEATNDGGFFVVWTSRKPEFATIRPQIFGRRFDQAGTALGTEFQISESSFVSRQYNPDLAVLENGFVVVWSAQGYGVLARVLAADATPAGSQFQVPESASYTSTRPAVAAAPASGFVVVWHTADLDGNGNGVFGRRFLAGGTPTGTEFQVNTVTSGDQDFADVASDTDGSFTVSFRHNPNDGGLSGVETMARCYDPQGLPLGAEFQVNVVTTDNQNFPHLARISPGTYVVVWQDQFDDAFGSSNIAARILGGAAPLCGDANSDGVRTATDALIALQTGVGANNCAPCVCDVSGMNGVAATDALVILQFSVGQAVALNCPSIC